ncbi:MAG: GGDEF domain-containing protein [Desulfobulbaceae bacterium]|nr:GGDEF domain-containing protein [Desulfobulbaceae bacterium]
MTPLQIFSICLVTIGACFLFASILTSLKTRRMVPEIYQGRWSLLIGFMIFFFWGYLTFVGIELMNVNLPSQIVTGVVFLGGALFVFLILKLTRNTISKVKEGEDLLRTARDELEIRVALRTEDLKAALNDLEKSASDFERVNAELLQILNSTADGIRVVGNDFMTLRVNQRFVKMVGIPEDELVGRPCHEGCGSKSCHTEECSLQKILNGTGHLETEREITKPNGDIISCILSAYPYFSEKGELIGIVEGFRDITSRKEMENKLQKMSVTDELTGLLNRRGFLSMAEKQLHLGKRLKNSVFLLYADLDNMKWINDNLGHDTGDQALIETAEILRSTFRKSDLICAGRLGGDEFALMMISDVGSCCEHPVLERLENKIDERNSKKSDRDYELSLSVGIVKYDKKNPYSVEEFISMGDAAMYQCKKERKRLKAEADGAQE